VDCHVDCNESSVLLKTCGCGRLYTSHTWRLLRLVGYQRDDRDPKRDSFEMRQCWCGSSLIIAPSGGRTASPLALARVRLRKLIR
jgi:hypothetical protein